MKNKTNQSALFPFLLLALTPMALAQTSATGRILDDSGKPIANAVTYLQSPQGGPSISQKADTTSAGGFSANGLADGVYEICVHMPDKNYINACQWLKNPPTITVKKGQVPVNLDVAVQTGVKVKLHVNDPGGNLQMKGPQLRPPALLVGVWSEKGFFYPMTQTGTNLTGADYELTVPYESDIKVTANGTALLVSLEKGTVADTSKAGASLLLRVNKGSAAKTLTLDINGPAK